MNLNEYIKRNYKNPNVQVLKALNASDNLISYLTHTPGNTNMQVVEAIVGSGSGNSAVVGEAIVGTAVI